MPLESASTLRGSIALLALCGALPWMQPATAQSLVDSFPAGFSANLGWVGDRDAFSGENGRLVLREGRSTPQPTARVWFPAITRDSACWEIEVEQRFSASASNRVRWWLAADRALSQAGVRGFYLQLGGISGNLDAIELVYEAGAGPQVFASGQEGIAAADPLSLKLEVCAQADRTWRWTARDLAGATVDQATGTAPQELRGQFSGFDIAFTSTRSGLLSFDNLRVAPVVEDTTAPELVLAKATGPTTVELLTDEALDPVANAVPGLYAVAGLPPIGVVVLGDTVRLTLSQNLTSGVAVPLRIGGLTDLAGNTSAPVETSVTYTAPRRLARFELLISELMVDPTPVVGLPDFEYVEIYNAGTSPVDLRDVRLGGDRVTVAFPAVVLAPGTYQSFARDNLGDSRFVNMPALPTLTNSGGTLRLLSDVGALIDEVTYDDAYYRSGTADGGYALERADVRLPCLLGADNLRSSSALAGGTPSARNSDIGPTVATDLAITSVTVDSPVSLSVATNRALRDATTAFELSGGRAFTVSEGSLLGTYILSLAEPLELSSLVTLSLTGEAASCLPGESRAAEEFAVGLPEQSRVGDWALNEIMYDPLSGQGRWVELANVSTRLLTLDGLVLARANRAGEVLARFTVNQSVLVPAGDLLVLAADPIVLARQFPTSRRGQVAAAVVPTLGSEDCLLLFDPATEEVYFHVCYSEDWHNQAYASTDGVSLERIDLGRPDQDDSNWTSAASSVGYATPTLPNSQARSLTDADLEAPFTLLAQRLSPDGDGFEDLLSVAYQLDESGVLARFSIVDPRGYVVYEATEDTSLGRTGVWTWDGVDSDGNLVGIGTYVARVEYWSPQRAARRAYFNFSVLRRL